MALDNPREQQPPKGAESGRQPLLGEFLSEVDKGRTALLGSKPMEAPASASPCVEKGPTGAATALVFNTDSIYQKNAQAADKRFAALAAA